MRLGALSWRIPRLALAGPLLAVIALTASLGLLTPQRAEALDSEEQAFLVTINDYRAQNGLGPLALNDALNNVARWMATDLGANNYFSHTDSLGRDPFQRMDQMGYAYNTWRGENLVAGTEAAPAAFQMWRDSPGHNVNMLGANYTVIGVARVYTQTSNYGWYWATEFGGAGAAPLPPPPPAPTQAPVYQPTTPAPAPKTVAQPAPVQMTDAPAPTVAATPPPPTPTSWAGPKYSQTAWWRSLDAVTEDRDAAAFAQQLMTLSPALEELFVQFVRGA
jgi:uncharacterized protein YkwD